jgi:hypothetical protein
VDARRLMIDKPSVVGCGPQGPLPIFWHVEANGGSGAAAKAGEHRRAAAGIGYPEEERSGRSPSGVRAHWIRSTKAEVGP